MSAKKVRFLFLLFCFVLLGAVPSFSQETPPQPPPAIITGALGIIQATPLYGKESTGWELMLDEPLQVGDNYYLRLPVDPQGFYLGPLVGQHVRATGTLELRRGTQPGEFITVLRLTGISAVK